MAVICFADKPDKIGFINAKGTIVVKPIYKATREFKNGFAHVEDDKTQFIIDKTGKVIWQAPLK